MKNENEKIKKKQVYSKSQQKVELILANKNSQTAIRLLRKKWKIPSDGFKLEEPKMIKIKKGVLFQETLGDLGKWEDWLNKSGKVNEFWQDLDNLRKGVLKPYKLSDRWLFFLQRHLLYGSTMPEAGLMIYLHKDEITGEPEIWIRIEGDTTLKDIKRGWKDIKKEQQRLLEYVKRHKEMPKLQRDKRIWELTEQGYSDKDIKEKIQKEFGENLMYYDIPKIRHRFKKKHHL